MGAFDELLTLAETSHLRRPCPKGPTRKLLKGRKDRAEAKQEKAVRAHCVDRDASCRQGAFSMLGRCDVSSPDKGLCGCYCDGPSELAHMHARRRSKTRGMAPDIRHDTKFCLMLCRFHHQQYDAKWLIITALTRKGADGALRFRRAHPSGKRTESPTGGSVAKRTREETAKETA